LSQLVRKRAAFHPYAEKNEKAKSRREKRREGSVPPGGAAAKSTSFPLERGRKRDIYEYCPGNQYYLRGRGREGMIYNFDIVGDRAFPAFARRGKKKKGRGKTCRKRWAHREKEKRKDGPLRHRGTPSDEGKVSPVSTYGDRKRSEKFL